MLFFAVPPIGFYLWRPYSQHVTRGINLILFLLILVGVGSVYFHSTLSIAGQLMDELLILWVVMTSYAILIPTQFIPKYFKTNRFDFNMIFCFIFCMKIANKFKFKKYASNSYICFYSGCNLLVFA